MTSTLLSRRDMLKGTMALAATTSVGVTATTRWHRAEAQESAALPRARIDGVLRQAVDAKDVPGVVVMAATDKGLLYEGAFGTRVLDNGAAMTLDTVFRIASMTKAVTCVAAMQLVEQGKLTLEDPVPNIDPALGSPQVLEGFDVAGAPRLRPAKRPITLRHLLTHTAGFSYEVWDANMVRYVKASGMPSMASGKVVALLETPSTPEFWPGGGGLYSTGRDYLAFLQMLLHGGSFNGAQLLRPETVALMGQNHIGNIPAGIMKTENPARSNDVDFFPGAEVRWGLGYMLNMQPGPNGRSAGTVSWGGIFNTYYWLDPVQRVTGLIMPQILPFADQRVLQLYGQFESAIYNAVKAA